MFQEPSISDIEYLLVSKLLFGVFFATVYFRFFFKKYYLLKTHINDISLEKYIDATPYLITFGFFASILFAIGFWNVVEHDTLVLWIAVLESTLIANYILLLIWRRHPSLLPANQWGAVFCIGTFLVGCAFSEISFFYDPSMNLSVQVQIILIAIGIPLAALPFTAIYLPAFYSFSLPLFISLLYLYWVIGAPDNQITNWLFLGITYISMLLVISRLHNKSLLDAITIQQANNDLIESLSRTNAKLQRMTYVDPLTGVYNRRTFMTKTEKMCCDLRGSNLRFVLLRLDLDHFKKVNDEHGEHGGDYVMTQIANRLVSSLLKIDLPVLDRDALVARFGGDEFLALLIGTFTENDLSEICALVRHNLGKPITFNDKIITPSLSMGIAVSEPSANCLEELLSKTDHALFHVKTHGKGYFRIV
ncbi:MAG: GGDEF domain-containing protein [Sedimenticola sp.]